jgi:CHAT domain-containing protein
MLLCGAGLATLGCNKELSNSPEQIYQDSWLKLRKGDTAAALQETDVALQKFSSTSSEWHWRFLHLKAEILVWQRRSGDALALLRDPLPSSYANTDLPVWRNLSLGMANAFLLKFDSAQSHLSDAESLAHSQHPDLLGEVELRKGTLAFYRQDFAGAEMAYQKALGYAREEKNGFLQAAALGSLGLVATKTERYDESLDWNRQALQLSQTLDAEVSVAKTLGNMGWAYYELGDFENALDLYEQAIGASKKAGLQGPQVDWQINVGNVHHSTGDLAAARGDYQEALSLARNFENQIAMTECYENLAILDLEAGQLDPAEQNARLAATFVREHNDPYLQLYAQLIGARIEIGKANYTEAEKLLTQVIRDQNGRASQIWEAEARLAEAYAQERRKQEADREYRTALQTIESARVSLKEEGLRLSFLSNPISYYSDYIDFLMSQNRSNDALEVAELSRARTLADGLGAGATSLKFPLSYFQPQQIAQRLHASLLFYWIGERNSYLWVIGPTKTAWFKLAKASEIEPVVKAYRKAVLVIHDARDAGSAEGKQLYSMLVEPAKKLIPAGSRVIVLPSESLYGLNFETLIVPDPQPHFWIEDVTVTTGNSLSLLASSATRAAPKEKSLFLLGDTESPGPAFPPLPQVREEMKLVEKYFPQSQTKVLEGKQATPSAYLGSNPERFSYVHFVTHGTASQTRPLESAVILSREGDSYKLYARDIVKHHLNASLVTISACNGSGTRAYSGEGLVGLSWAFLRAGAHNVIGALWEVSEASTPQLMDAFYGELFQNKDPATALRDAKLKLLHSADADSVFKKPFYWAPFQLYAGS